MLFEYGFYLTKPIWALICLHDVTQESVAALTYHFADAFVGENVARVYDIVMTLWLWLFDAEAIFFREILCKKRNFQWLSDVFSAV